MINIRCIKLSILLTCFAIPACDSNQPSKSEILGEVNSLLPPATTVTEIQYKVFPNNQDSSIGRISVTGDGFTTDDRIQLYKDWSVQLLNELKPHGVTPGQFRRYANNIGLRGGRGLSGRPSTKKIYKLVLPSGSEFSFSTELLYKETADGFTYRGKVKVDLPGSTSSKVTQRKNIDIIMYGADEYTALSRQLLESHSHEMVAIPAAIKKKYRSISGSKIYRDGELVGRISDFEIDFSEPRIYNEIYSVEQPVDIDAYKDFYIAYTKLKKGINKGKFRINMSVAYKTPLAKQACVKITLVMHGRIPGPACWDGLTWSGELTDDSAKKSLIIKP